ncbi:sugar porter family MFS transporter [Alteromonas sp. C1M14]|uniref:sugar porter family MFS transporter n=1 Tax=Alteromonas sp. C1M14 TaxID=2841567 RepID=UPI001C09963E|nr:sugar porter family MFS transporter [Alteromonas sp. C1M14]MBU2977757.1 sugar porter family MFS transporter [Alteromonas sp. C1M14]
MRRLCSPTLYFTLIVSLGGFIFGFDASVISGAIGFIDNAFGLTEWQQGFVVSSPTLGALVAMMVAGVISDGIGRRKTLIIIAFLYLVSAICSALAINYWMLLAARFIGGMAFCSLIIAPVYISEISAPEHRGRMVSVNQLNIVLGFALSYFSNYYFLQLSQRQWDWVKHIGIAEHPWRFMLGMEVLPAVVWLLLLFTIPRSPRWLMLKKRTDEAAQVVKHLFTPEQAQAQLQGIQASLHQQPGHWKQPMTMLVSKRMRFPLILGLILAISQQITGINVIFFYAPTIFEQSGVGTNAAFMQAIWVGIVNVIFTIVAMACIDRWGRKPLLITGLSGVIISMLVCAYGFAQAQYQFDSAAMPGIGEINEGVLSKLYGIQGQVYESDVSFKQALLSALGKQDYDQYHHAILSASISMNAPLVLLGIIAFVASYAISLGPVMWAMLAEIFPNQTRALAISLVGVVNALTSFSVQFLFPWELMHLGAAVTFAIYGGFAVISLLLVLTLFPETKGRTLEQIEKNLLHKQI